MVQRIIALLTDFGYKDPYVGVMKGVIKSINPDAEIVDITHSITRQDVYEAAIALMVSAKYFPRNTIFVCVVDPGVGSARRALLIRTNNYFLIGPDNGCLTLLARRDRVKEVYDISNSRYRLSEVSATFHGRDVFAPIAAYVSLGYKPEQLGSRIEPSLIKYIEVNPPTRRNRGFSSQILYIDVFGNIMTNADREFIGKIGLELGEKLVVRTSSREAVCRYVASFSHVDPDSYACYINSWGFFEVAINMGNAAKELNAKRGEEIVVEKTS
ncbi:MAG: hypothetical protein DRO13_03165 [Thermoprotei archaeon]|nr:MAG: hypothetical protein DRO13_03165 [Thermoprotei archaeon]